MILPTKHIAPENSLLGVGAMLLELLAHEQTVTRLWNRAREENNALTFPQFVLALDVLFSIRAINLGDGVLHRRIVS